MCGTRHWNICLSANKHRSFSVWIDSMVFKEKKASSFRQHFCCQFILFQYTSPKRCQICMGWTIDWIFVNSVLNIFKSWRPKNSQSSEDPTGLFDSNTETYPWSKVSRNKIKESVAFLCYWNAFYEWTIVSFQKSFWFYLELMRDFILLIQN